MFLFKIKTYAFIGPSGTGKSYRAQYVASGKGIKYIIDDGLLIKDSQVIAGISANGTTEIYNLNHIDRGYEHIEEKFKNLGAKIERIKTEEEVKLC